MPRQLPNYAQSQYCFHPVFLSAHPFESPTPTLPDAAKDHNAILLNCHVAGLQSAASSDTSFLRGWRYTHGSRSLASFHYSCLFIFLSVCLSWLRDWVSKCML